MKHRPASRRLGRSIARTKRAIFCLAMSFAAVDNGIDPGLVKSWLQARSISRNLPQPVRDSGGLRLDTDLPTEKCRYVFASPCEGIADVAKAVSEPLVYLKLCGTSEQLRSTLPAHWTMLPLEYLMTLDQPENASIRLPAAYRLETHADGATTNVVIMAENGDVAADGYATKHCGVFIYDRIGTDPNHRRLGLGYAVMNSLGRARKAKNARQVLVATEIGRSLYANMGWSVRSPWATACIPDTVLSTTRPTDQTERRGIL